MRHQRSAGRAYLPPAGGARQHEDRCWMKKSASFWRQARNTSSTSCTASISIAWPSPRPCSRKACSRRSRWASSSPTRHGGGPLCGRGHLPRIHHHRHRPRPRRQRKEHDPVPEGQDSCGLRDRWQRGHARSRDRPGKLGRRRHQGGRGPRQGVHHQAENRLWHGRLAAVGAEVVRRVATKPIIADGGIRSTRHCKKHPLGATMVMIGSLFAGHEESPGQTVNVDGALFKEYYGSASDFNKGEYKHSKGKRILEPIKGPLMHTLIEMEQDVQSSISYSGGKKLMDIRKRVGAEEGGAHGDAAQLRQAPGGAQLFALVRQGQAVAGFDFDGGDAFVQQLRQARQGQGDQFVLARLARGFDAGYDAAASAGDFFVAGTGQAQGEFVGAFAAVDEVGVAVDEAGGDELAAAVVRGQVLVDGGGVGFSAYPGDAALLDDDAGLLVISDGRVGLEQTGHQAQPVALIHQAQAAHILIANSVTSSRRLWASTGCRTLDCGVAHHRPWPWGAGWSASYPIAALQHQAQASVALVNVAVIGGIQHLPLCAAKGRSGHHVEIGAGPASSSQCSAASPAKAKAWSPWRRVWSNVCEPSRCCPYHATADLPVYAGLGGERPALRQPRPR
ncbi:hypothetical protein FQA39_LY19306 [Lamprigera yunnana]|nr:hypothetical protein FQA39_LY19306 [Lamprigera yunnana]